jgi:hypothetical protein
MSDAPERIWLARELQELPEDGLDAYAERWSVRMQKCLGPEYIRADVVTDRIASLEAQLAEARKEASDWLTVANQLTTHLEAADARLAERHRAGWDAAMKAAAFLAWDDEDETIDRTWEHWGEYRNVRTAEIVAKAIAAAILAIPNPGDEG